MKNKGYVKLRGWGQQTGYMYIMGDVQMAK